MAKVATTMGRPIQGVSQQPDEVRRDGQCTLQENMFPSPVEGLSSRAGTKQVARLSTDSFHPDSLIHFYRRDNAEAYYVVLEPNETIRVFNEEGVGQLLQNTTSFPYVVDPNPRQNLRMVTIGDFTFIVNRSVETSQGTSRSPALVEEAIVYVQFANYGRRYQILIDDVVRGEYLTPNGDSPEQIQDIDTSNVASQLVSTGSPTSASDTGQLVLDGDPADNPTQVRIRIPANATFQAAVLTDNNQFLDQFTTRQGSSGLDILLTIGGNIQAGANYRVFYTIPSTSGLSALPGFTVTRTGNVIHIRKDDGSAFSLDTFDGAGGQDMIAIKGEVTTISQLPDRAPSGFRVKVRQSGDRQESSFWLRAVEQEGDNVIWVEDVAPNQVLGFDSSTMPHVLRRDEVINGQARFSMRLADWDNRDVGDDSSNPFPSFVGNTINDIGLFQNRLVFLSGESVVTSRSGEFFNFFRETTQSAIDSDPFDVYADSSQVNVLQSHVYLEGDLVAFSDRAQFILPGDRVITQDNATLRQISSYESQRGTTPVSSGQAIFFPFEYGQFTGVSEFYTDDIAGTRRAFPITDHVDRYIQGNVEFMRATTNRNWLLVQTDEVRNTLYVYNYVWQGDEKVQSAWHSWVWPEGESILSAEFDDDTLRFIISRPSGTYLEEFELGDPNDANLDFPVRLDRKQSASATLSSGVITIPDPLQDVPVEELAVVITDGAFDEYKGTLLNFQRVGQNLESSDVVSNGNFSVIVGRRYLSKYQPSKPLVKDFRDRVIESDRLTLARVGINYIKVGELRVRVVTPSREDTYNFDGRFIGRFNNVIGFADIQQGSHQFPVMQRSDLADIFIETDSHIPFQLRDLEYRGQFTQRGRRF